MWTFSGQQEHALAWSAMRRPFMLTPAWPFPACDNSGVSTIFRTNSSNACTFPLHGAYETTIMCTIMDRDLTASLQELQYSTWLTAVFALAEVSTKRQPLDLANAEPSCRDTSRSESLSTSTCQTRPKSLCTKCSPTPSRESFFQTCQLCWPRPS